MTDLPDIDIEVIDREAVIDLFPEITIASQVAGNKLVKHVGVYFQKIPRNPLNDLSALPFKLAEKQGFHKIDVLSCPYPYEGIETMEQLQELLDTPINWDWFKDAEFNASLFQLNKYPDVVAHYMPQSIEDLACLVAIIRPQKQYLFGEPWETVRAKIWEKEPERKGKPFKKSHSVSYALIVGLDARLKAPGFFDIPLVEGSAVHRILSRDRRGV